MPKMSMNNDEKIRSYKKLITPKELKEKKPTTHKINDFVKSQRAEVKDILNRKNDRLIFVVGPCSIHNIAEAKEYARQLKTISDKVKDKILIVMRVYFEKPRTTIGWKGLINDPDLNETYDVNKGLEQARELLLYINSLELPCGYEVLDTITPQYLCDLISWGAIGARTTESQVHRELVSGLSMPIGFKNGTGGTVTMAADAIVSSSYPHCFMGITNNGEAAIYETNGNQDTHVILRGGTHGPNYKEKDINSTSEILKTKNIKNNIMVDCSHGNSQKDHKNQPLVLGNVIEQILKRRRNGEEEPIIGVMLESNLNEGKQTLDSKNSNKLKKGVSITDACINIETTQTIVEDAATQLLKYPARTPSD